MNYQVIVDRRELDDFINNFLPDLYNDEKFYITLFGRKKYTTDERFKADKTQIKRIACNKEFIVDNLLQLEVREGIYKHGDLEIPQEMLAVYIQPNPRSMERASLRMLSAIAKRLENGEQLRNPKSEAMNCIQVSASRKPFYDIDIDNLSDYDELIDWIKSNDIVNEDTYKNSIIQTRGGFHILLDLEELSDKYKKSWYNNFVKLSKDASFNLMMNGDGLVPIPGCVQGGFTPKLLAQWKDTGR